MRSDLILTDAARHPSTSRVGAHPGATGHPGNAPRAQVRSYRPCDSSENATLHGSASPVGAHPGATGHTGNAARAQVRSYRDATAARMPRCTCRL
ncbi:hypothetical protein HZS92_01915 [Xanthomonas citri pv. citri]|nr:hypothetical protein HZS92_01915 [Xanthomonas citri pv. citri]